MIKQVTMYSVVCDRCGKTFEADDIVAWTDECSAREYALDSEWNEIGDKHYCPDCYEYDESIDEYVPKVKGEKQMSNQKARELVVEALDYLQGC